MLPRNNKKPLLIALLSGWITFGQTQEAINHQNPLWAFDFLVESWKNQQDAYTTRYRIEADSSFINPQFRDYYGQALMTAYTLEGDIEGKDHAGRLFRDEKQKLTMPENLSPDILAADARSFLLEKADKKQAILINEAHLYPQHRLFMTSLLPGLYELGYRHIFVEALDQDSVEIPSKTMGIYTSEPAFAHLTRQAIALGFQLHPYDAPTIANRDSAAARNILERTKAFSSQDKWIVFCGFDHNNQQSRRSLAHYLKTLADMDPMCVDQTIYSEPENSRYYQELLDYYAIQKPTILTDRHGEAVPLNNASNRDYFVISPRTAFLNGYPIWLTTYTACQWLESPFTDYDTVEVYYQEEMEKTKYPIPFSVKRKSRDNEDLLLVPDDKPYRLIYYMPSGEKREIKKIL